MKVLKKITKWFLYFLMIPVSYIIVSLILSSITIDRKVTHEASNHAIYLSTNGIHLDIVIPTKDLDSMFLSGIRRNPTDTYLSFGWGDKDFYIHTRNWGDLTFRTAFKALFLKSATLIHITRHQTKSPDWKEIKITENELRKLSNYLLNTFKTDKKGMKIILHNKGYTYYDDFYKSKGSYSCFKTCNTWVNTGFKESGLKACLWTPFDFGLMNKYE